MRECTECGKNISKGYVLYDGEYYFCSDECMNEAGVTMDDFYKMCNESSYYTEWDDECNIATATIREDGSIECSVILDGFRNSMVYYGHGIQMARVKFQRKILSEANITITWED